MMVPAEVPERIARVAVLVLLRLGALDGIVPFGVHHVAPAALERPNKHRTVLLVDQQRRPLVRQPRRVVLDGVEPQRQPIVRLDLDLELLAQHVDHGALVGLGPVAGGGVRRDDKVSQLEVRELVDQPLRAVALLHQLPEHQQPSVQILLPEDQRRAGHARVEADHEVTVQVELERLGRQVQRALEGGHHRLAGDRVAPLGLDELLHPRLGLALGLVGVVAPLPRQVLDVFRARAEP